MSLIEDLRDREIEILRLVATGASNKEIASQLNISTNTVKVHLRNIFAKIGVSSRTEAAMVAVSMGLVPDVKGAPSPAGPEAPLAEPPEVLVFEPPQPAEPVKPLSGRISRRWWLVAAAGLILVLVLGVWIAGQAGLFSRGAAQPVASSEVTSNWTQLAALPQPRSSLALVGYEDQISAIGGDTPKGVTGQVETYNPTSNRWRSGQPKPLPVKDVGAVVIGGKIYVPGGATASGKVTDRLEVYDPASDSWQQGPPLPHAISAYAIVAFDGGLYLFGGWDGKSVLNTVYRFNPAAGEWTSMPAMPTPRKHLGAAVSGRKIYVLGGEDQNGPLPSNEVFLPDLVGGPQSVWQTGVSLPEPMYGMGVASVADIIYIVGGMGASPAREYPILAYDPTQGWREIQSLQENEFGLFPGLANLGKYLYIAGGESAHTPTDRFIRYQAVFTVSIPLIIK